MIDIKDIKKLRVAVGLSGGVDSSVAAYLLKEIGYEVCGVHMICWDEKTAGCTADQDRKDAARVAAYLGISFEALNFVKEYKDKVIDYFYSEYKAGRTPNPDVMCNKEIKFGMFLNWAVKNGFDYIATGHYARVRGSSLLKGVDDTKDQSYFLYRLGSEQLKRTIFPLGEMYKKDVRKLAEKIGLHNSNKPDSVGICFVGEVDIKKFLQREIKIRKGNVMDKEGNIIGKHDGMEFYTIGQRHGYTLNKYLGLPTYVIAKNPERNEIVVGFVEDVNKNEFEVDDLSFVEKKPEFAFGCVVRVRHLGEFYNASVTFLDDKKSKVKVLCENPVFGVAPGQSAVFYDGDIVIGGGTIHG